MLKQKLKSHWQEGPSILPAGYLEMWVLMVIGRPWGRGVVGMEGYFHLHIKLSQSCLQGAGVVVKPRLLLPMLQGLERFRRYPRFLSTHQTSLAESECCKSKREFSEALQCLCQS